MPKWKIENGEIKMKKIFVVEDDESICQELVQILENEGYEAESLESFDNTKDDILKAAPNLVLMDINIPGINGRNLVKEIRKESDVPIIMVTSRTSEMDEVLSMSYGADDYITKPFNILEVKARMKAILRRNNKPEKEQAKSNVLNIGDMRIDCDSRSLFIRGKEIYLTAKEFDLLELLAFNPNRVYSRDVLLKTVWGADYPGDGRTVDVHIRRLREKIEDNSSEPKYVHTKWGVGYYFNV